MKQSLWGTNGRYVTSWIRTTWFFAPSYYDFKYHFKYAGFHFQKVHITLTLSFSVKSHLGHIKAILIWKLSCVGAVLVSSFEYFFYHFFNLPIRVQLANIGVSVTSTNSDTVYPLLLEDYLAHLLPIDPLRQSKLFSQDIHSNQVCLQMVQSKSTCSFGGKFLREQFFPTTSVTFHYQSTPIV